MKIRQLVSCSPERLEALRKAKQEFENNKEFQAYLDKEWKCRKAMKKPRIKKERNPIRLIITISGWESLKMEVSFKEYKEDYEGKGVRVIKEIY